MNLTLAQNGHMAMTSQSPGAGDSEIVKFTQPPRPTITITSSIIILYQIVYFVWLTLNTFFLFLPTSEIYLCGWIAHHYSMSLFTISKPCEDSTQGCDQSCVYFYRGVGVLVCSVRCRGCYLRNWANFFRYNKPLHVTIIAVVSSKWRCLHFFFTFYPRND